jgi:hypothetical protein
MMYRIKTISILLLTFFFVSGKQSVFRKVVIVKNNLAFNRTEIVTISIQELDASLKTVKPGQMIVKQDGKMIISQLIDTNSDSAFDELVFQVALKANEEKKVIIERAKEREEITRETKTYSRFVPERIDDYAWENDLVAFRTYGPEAQRLTESGEKGGTLTSGLGCWLKRVNYPVIDKWYKKYVAGGSYHKDDGEGYDPYHVGISRGCGGIGVWKNDSLYVSKNFVSYKKIADGPLRNIFELTYAPWQADGATIQETKRITIDLGNQLYRVEDKIGSSAPIPNIAIGITLHDKKGTVLANSDKGYFSHWEPMDDSELGTGIVIAPPSLIGFKEFRTEKKDLSHLYVVVKPQTNVTYYAGFGWAKAGIIKTSEEWNQYLNQFTQRLASPVLVMVK